mgnify:CR=1 FL=1
MPETIMALKHLNAFSALLEPESAISRPKPSLVSPKRFYLNLKKKALGFADRVWNNVSCILSGSKKQGRPG